MHPDDRAPGSLAADVTWYNGGERTPWMGAEVDDRDLIDRITHLVAEEQKLQASEHDPGKLRELEVTLDQLWDLLRQRRAKSQYGENPDEADARPEPEVEGYLQ
jgi:hypothetical protein